MRFLQSFAGLALTLSTLGTVQAAPDVLLQPSVNAMTHQELKDELTSARQALASRPADCTNCTWQTVSTQTTTLGTYSNACSCGGYQHEGTQYSVTDHQVNSCDGTTKDLTYQTDNCGEVCGSCPVPTSSSCH